MWQLSTKGRYGTRLMFQLALNYGQGPMLLKDIAKNEDLSTKYLEHIVPLLKSANFINSTRGAHGGYALAKEPAEIDLRTLVAVLEGDIAPVDCVDSPDICERSDTCVARDVWSILEDRINETLEDITLQDMVDNFKEKYELT
ncbi:MAG TPA: Rrf2 family transcriptional regulator [bacterium]|nr:Rrf2 family transcriptional regulator [bacterium]